MVPLQAGTARLASKARKILFSEKDIGPSLAVFVVEVMIL